MVSPSTPGTATGLGRFGEVRLLESPNTSENYLQQEMGYRIARKHARKLRAFVMIFAYGLPFLLTLVSLVTMLGAYGGIAAILAALSGLSGMLVERWLFFAQAKHTVMLYYGAKTA
jgi:DMSO reductase anchor subunit